MAKMKEVLLWTAYIIAACVAVGVVATGGLVFLAIGATVVVVALAALFVWFTAALIKHSWENRSPRR